jgi:hypothetical protein
VWLSSTINLPKFQFFLYSQARGGRSDLRNKRTEGEKDEGMPSVGGILMDFVENAQRLPHFSV